MEEADWTLSAKSKNYNIQSFLKKVEGYPSIWKVTGSIKSSMKALYDLTTNFESKNFLRIFSEFFNIGKNTKKNNLKYFFVFFFNFII